MKKYFDLETVVSVATLVEIVESDKIYDLLDHVFKRTIESYEYEDSMLKARSYLWEVYPILKTLMKKDAHCEKCIALLRKDLGSIVTLYPMKKGYRILKETKGYVKTIKDWLLNLFLLSIGAKDGTWTHTELSTSPSSLRVYQFRHLRIRKL